MVTLQKIDEVAIRWNKTKDPKDKELWYKLIKGMSNSLYVKFLMRKLIQYLETGKQKEAQKIIKKIMEELDR
jgi:hypothetical protein